MSTHTQGPLVVSSNVSRHIISPRGGVVACVELTWDKPCSSEIADANARRLVACWNACDGITTHTLEFFGAVTEPLQTAAYAAGRADEREESAKLLEALREIADMTGFVSGEIARAALAAYESNGLDSGGTGAREGAKT